MTAQIIAKDGRPEWAVIPYEKYLALVEDSEMLQDIQDYDSAKQAIENGEKLVPGEVTFSILDGRNPIRAWREQQNMTLSQLAEASGAAIHELEKIERSQRTADAETLAAIAYALDVDIDDIAT